MVYLREVISANRMRIFQYNNIETVSYLFLSNSKDLEQNSFDLTQEEKIAYDGYANIDVDISTIIAILNKPTIKGIDATTNIFKFAGLYLSSKNYLTDKLHERFEKGSIKDKFFLYKIEPSLKDSFLKELGLDENNPFSVVINSIFEKNDVSEELLNGALSNLIKTDLDVQTLLLFEELEKYFLQIKFVSKSSEEVLRDLFNNFSNAIQKIISNRRKDHPNFVIKDEYDVQDILYVIIKSFFPNMRDEDPIPKVGGKSTKIDLILREEKILIEVKMIKEKDPNETHFIEQLKVDFESYHKCVWLKKLFCFVYDPHRKTRDISNFNDLNGERVKAEHCYDVEVIVVN